MRRGVELDDGPTRLAEVREIGNWSSYGVVELEIHEGRNRRVRRMVRAVRVRVRQLRGVAIGAVQLGELASGTTRELTASEVRALRG